MWKIIIEIVLITAYLHAQTDRDLLLPKSRHILGMVLDTDGKPVSEARIDHSGDRREAHQSNSDGKFDLETRAPILVIRKPGFRSELVRTQDATDVRVTLKKLPDAGRFPTCSNTGQYDGIEGWGASFRFLRMPGVKASREGHDIDYGARSYYVKTQQGRKGIMHGSGPMWTLGVPLDGDVWRSVKYDEVMHDAGAVLIIDARGQLPDGKRWRYLGHVGESASYSDMDDVTAHTLDKFLDGACVNR